ncbi:hypothetical protein BDN72DRAFT_771272 [Pluteus cervinus]|uniref:Uncharacterized protein n=1 Tax=Pluteus cervinus TaxID=181527 RepID=A0ACD3AMX4_9AGAR|nr:hypothetical protein BDN72DRAFT_771272 [Pluteus cervinus]
MEIPHKKYLLIPQLSGFVGIIFGAIHFISRDSSFPTRTELLLWRISCIILVAHPTVILLFNIIRAIYDHELWWKSMLLFLGRFTQIFVWSAAPISYILARFCVLVLAFLTLNHLPPRALDNIIWTSYIPHL